LAKRKIKKKIGVKSLKLPTLLSYLLAGVGAVFIVIFLGYVFAKSLGTQSKNEINTAQKAVWTKDVNEWKTSGTLLSASKDSNGDGIAKVSKSKWEKLPFDSKEALAIAVARSEEIKTLQIKDENDYNLGICRNGTRLWENKN
jgi:hypothetical protein